MAHSSELGEGRAVSIGPAIRAFRRSQAAGNRVLGGNGMRLKVAVLNSSPLSLSGACKWDCHSSALRI